MDWVAKLTERGAAELPHAEIARLALELLGTNSAPPENPEWWAQGVTVAYEQHIGRRLPGQRSDGSFQASASKTFAGNKDEALAALTARYDGATEINSIALDGEPATSATEKWRYWRVSLADGTRIQAVIDDKAAGKARIGLQHSNLTNPDDVVAWKAFWKLELGEL